MKTLKYLFLSIMFIFSCSAVQAQEWAPIGAEWDYGYYEVYIPTGEFWFHIEVEKDTVINDVPCRKLIQTNTDPGGDVEEQFLYTYEKNDSVFFYFDHTDAFHLVYDFTASVGDTLELTSSENDPDYPVKVRLDSITTFNSNNGVALKEYHYSDNDAYGSSYETVIQGIGNLAGIRPIFAYFVYAPPVEEFRCFRSSTIEYSITDECDYFGLLDAVSGPSELNLKIFPNPASDKLYIANDQELGNYTYSLININGQPVLRDERYSAGIDIIDLPVGVYMLLVRNAKGEQWVEWVEKM